MACYAKVSNKFLGTIAWPTGNPYEVVTSLQQEGAKLLPNDQCCYSFMGVFINQQEVTSREFVNSGNDDDLPDRLAHAQQGVNQVHFMWVDQRCRDYRKGVRYSFDEKTRILRAQPYVSHQLSEFTKFDFKTPTLGLSVPHTSCFLLYFDFLRVLHVDYEIDETLPYISCLTNLRVLFGQVSRWKKDYVDDLVNLAHLETIRASGPNWEVRLLVNKISKLKNLKHVELVTTTFRHKRISGFGELHMLSNLADLRLSARLFQTTIDLLNLALLPNLETLHILDDENTSLRRARPDKAFQTPHQLFKNLKHLQIGTNTSKWPDLDGLEPNPNSFTELYLRVT